MQQPLKIRSFGATDRGLSRATNEDAFLVDDALGLYAVADGVGGLSHGDVASQLAIKELHRHMVEQAPYEVIDWHLIFNKISHAIHEEGKKQGAAVGIGTTLTVLWINYRTNQAHFAHAGDSMLYLLRFNEEPYKLTVDHTIGQELINRSSSIEDLYIPEIYMHSLTRCLGQYDNLLVDVGSFTLEPGERLLLCTDGFLLGYDIELLSQKAFGAETPEMFIKSMVDEGNAAGGHDNLTGIGIFVEKEN